MTDAISGRRLLPLERVLAKSLQWVIVVWTIVCAGSAMVLREFLGYRFWILVWLGPSVLAAGTAVLLTRRVPQVVSADRWREWRIAFVVALLPNAVLLLLFLLEIYVFTSAF